MQQWKNGPLPEDCTVSTEESTPLSDVRLALHPRAALATIASTGTTALVESFYVHIPALRATPAYGTGDPAQWPRVVDEISYFDDFYVLQLSEAARESEKKSGIRVYVYLSPSFGGESREAFAAHTAGRWNLDGKDHGKFVLWVYGAKENEGYLAAGAAALAELGEHRLTAIHNGMYQVAQRRENNMGAAFMWMMQTLPQEAKEASASQGSASSPPPATASSAGAGAAPPSVSRPAPADPGQAVMNHASELLKSGQYSELAALVQPLADNGVAWAQFVVGLIFNNGYGVTKDTLRAATWYRKSADQGYQNAQNNLGFLYYTGDGIPKDVGQAVTWYQKAAAQGQPGAQFRLGYAYIQGEGISQNVSEGINWLSRAAAQGNASAENQLGILYYSGNGVPKDVTQAASWYRKAAEGGNSSAQTNLGIMLYRGEGVSRDLTEATVWLRKSAQQGNADAQRALANIGKGTESAL